MGNSADIHIVESALVANPRGKSSMCERTSGGSGVREGMWVHVICVLTSCLERVSVNAPLEA